MLLSEYSLARAEKLNKMSIPEMEGPIPIKFLWLDIIDSADNGRNYYRQLHLHSFYEVHFVISGEACYECAGKTVTISQDHALLIPPKTPHYRIEDDRHFLKLSFAFFWDSDKGQGINLPRDKSTLFVFPRQVSEDFDRILQICDQNDIFSAHLISSLCLCVFHTVLRSLNVELPPRSEPGTDPRLAIAKAFIRNNKHRLIGCEDVAKECCLSSKQLSRIFKTHTGMTLFEYIINQRYRYAKHLLLQSDATVKEIGYMLGFGNESGFISFFKRQSGTTPFLFRKQDNKEDTWYPDKNV